MYNLLSKLFAKRGIKDVKELSEEERKNFDEWQKILSKEELTIEDIKNFCQSQIEIIEGKWRDLTIEHYKKSEWIPYHTIYKTLLMAMESPRLARENLEKVLNDLINK